MHSDKKAVVSNAKRVLQIAKDNPILREGFSDLSLFEKYEDEIAGILQDSFSPILTHNEIKTASIPLQDIIFNKSERFKKILNDAGDNFKLEIKNLPEDHNYIIACSIILRYCYGYDLNFKRPFFYEIPDKKGVMRYYKILYNADFIEITPNKNAPKITAADYDQLIDNFDDLELWKTKFPPNSYDLKVL